MVRLLHNLLLGRLQLSTLVIIRQPGLQLVTQPQKCRPSVTNEPNAALNSSTEAAESMVSPGMCYFPWACREQCLANRYACPAV